MDVIGKINITKLENTQVWNGTIRPTRFNLNYLQFVFPEDFVEEQDINFMFKSKEIKFSFWVNTYFFVDIEELSREMPVMSRCKQVGVELKQNQLDKFTQQYSAKTKNCCRFLFHSAPECCHPALQ